MKRFLQRSLVYALGALILVICYVETRSAGQVDVSLQDESGPIMTYSFPATACGSYDQQITVVRDGQVRHFELGNKVVFSRNGIDLQLNYRRDGQATASRQTLLLSSSQSEPKRWTHLDDHLMAAASLR